tara:strand:- start:1988 stop:2599 length:612 start_codon:yes stop_codon:yes gene_type:complete
MGRSKIPHKFGSIPVKLWEKLEGNDKQFLFKYDYHRKKMIELDEEIEELKLDIEEKKNKKEKHRKRSEEIYKNNKHLKDDYSVSLNISKNDRYTSIRERQGFNTEGKSKTQLLKERKFVGRYWLVNIKYKGKTKSVHIGNDDYVKDFIKKDEYLNQNMELPDKLSEEDIRDCINVLVRENVYDLVTSGDNLLDKKIRFTDLVD